MALRYRHPNASMEIGENTYIVNLSDNISETLGQGLTLALEQTVTCLGALELLLHDAQRPSWNCIVGREEVDR